MVKRNLKDCMQMVLVLFVMLCSINVANAGPGGGTYYANSPAGGASGTALRKFVDSLPGLGFANRNNLGSYIPLATPIVGKAGVPADGEYYEVGVVEYSQKMHSDLPKKTKLRGYVDLNPVFLNGSTAQNRAQYLGPLIIAKRNVPVRLKFVNMLPTAAAGNLFIPVDTTLMGAGAGPLTAAGTTCDQTLAPGSVCANYTQNRATLHLHGGNSPWISDGTPHQWTAPATEATPFKKGVSTRNVPDMPGGGGVNGAPVDGEMSFFWTNQQSNRLMFYHDHSYGLTRLNVYAGEAAGYLLTDTVEDGLIASSVIPGLDMVNAGHPEYKYGSPRSIQDRTFVPQNVAVQDAKWINPTWGGYGDLWFPHVYEPNQDPTSSIGANPFGRWDYGPWFWPPVRVAAANSTLPEPSTTPEAFHDTPIVNGTAYPYVNVEPKAYRFRILNASNDRGLNLSLFYSDPNDPSGKEVKMVPAGPNPTFPAGPFPAVANWPTDGRKGGVPDPATMGPKMIQIGSESGFLPSPVVHPNQPVNYDYNRRNIVVLNMLEKNLFLGPAERADVIVDFSTVPSGSTLIMYNDAPAPTPAFDERYDYYTGDPDQTAGGGAPSTLRGYGPNTRTIMQFRVAGTPGAAYNLTNLQAALPVAFKAAQPAPLIPQPTLPVASGGYSPTELYGKIQDYGFTFKPLNSDYTQSAVPVTIPFQSKAIQELWDPFGRMNATLGVELPFTTNLNQTTIPMGYAEPATEKIIDGQPQIWKITHNGVDTHPVHFHMFDVQVVNRVGWDGAIRPPDDNELGWKETVRMNPLEDIVIALRPKSQTLPATWNALNPDGPALPLPISKRAIDPTLPPSALIASTDITTNPAQGTAKSFPNVPDPVNFPLVGYSYGFEYVWHCHILGHEENDFMRPVVFAVSNVVPDKPTTLAAFKGGETVTTLKPAYVANYMNKYINQVVLRWIDGVANDHPSNFRVERCAGAGCVNFTPIATVSFLPGYPPIYTDTSVSSGVTYNYQVVAFNAIGDSALPHPTVSKTLDTWTGATLPLTLTASKPTNHVVGTNVQFTAAATGATSPAIPNPNPNGLAVAYQYRFWLTSGATTTLVQDYSTSPFWTMPDTTPVGVYTVKVDVRTDSNVALEQTTSLVYTIINTPTPPVTVASPVPAVYSTPTVTVTLTATTNAPPATIFYTLDGTLPTTASTIYTAPIILNNTTTINYFAQDVNGVAEAVHSDTWYFHSNDLVSSIKINNGATVINGLAVTLNLSATDPVGVATMQFANANSVTPDCLASTLTWTFEEPYSTSKSWSLATGSDGNRTVCVRFRDKSLPTGVQYAPISAAIILDTTAPVTTPSPIPGNYTNGSPLSVTLSANETATIYYTADGTTPTTGSPVYATPIQVNSASGASTTIKFFAVDTAGNVEALQTKIWSMATIDLVASIKINNGATWTPDPNVTLTMNVSDPSGVASYWLSKDNIIWGGPYASPNTAAGAQVTITVPNAAVPLFTLDNPGSEGVKSVYVKFTDTNLGGGTTYPPIATSILQGAKDGILPGTNSELASSIKALKIDSGELIATPLDLLHGDLAPYIAGRSQPNGKIDLRDAYEMLLKSVGLRTSF